MLATPPPVRIKLVSHEFYLVLFDFTVDIYIYIYERGETY